jgi:hypothetical protein
MGLDITAYRKIEPVRKWKGDDDGYDEGLARFWILPDFKAAADDVKEETLYRYAEEFDFRAGSYSGYNAWRAWLAGLVGTTPEKVWNNPKPGPFVELINFADNEGTIGPKTAAKLAKDFAEYDSHAKKASTDGWEYERYQHWRKAMEMAADGGAISFH